MDLLGTRYLEQIHFESPLKRCSQCLHRLENLWKCTSEHLAEQGFLSTLLNRDTDYRSINDTGCLLSVLWKFLPSSPFFTASATAIYPCYIHVDLFHSAPLPLLCVWQVIQEIFCFYDKHSFSLYGIFGYLNKKSLYSTFQKQIGPFFETHWWQENTAAWPFIPKYSCT